MRRLSLQQDKRGDTIVEVLIAIAVVSLVLAVSYGITNRTVATTQDTQEHNQAQQIAQQQIEKLRALSAADITLPGFANGKCLIISGSVGFSTTASQCNFNSDGTAGPCSTEPCYNTSIVKVPTTGAYEITVSWHSLLGNDSQVVLDYGI